MKTLSFKKLVGLSALLFAGLFAMAGNPNFSGTWKLNKSKSSLSTQYSFAPSAVTISQDEKGIEVSRSINLQGSDMIVVEKMTLDGAECTNEGYQGSKKISTAAWSEDGISLIVNNKIGGAGMNSRQIYSMDGNSLKIESAYSSSYGDLKETWVLEKE